MFKKMIVLILVSVGIILVPTLAPKAIQGLIFLHDWIANGLSTIFSGGFTAKTLKELIALLAVPFVIGFVFTVIYWILRKRFFPYFMEIVWAIWLLQVGAMIMMTKAGL